MLYRVNRASGSGLDPGVVHQLCVFVERNVGRVDLIQDAEQSTSAADDYDRFRLDQFGDDPNGGVLTAAWPDDHGLVVTVPELPQPGLEKVDPDDYLQGRSDILTPPPAEPKSVDCHLVYDADHREGCRPRERRGEHHHDRHRSLSAGRLTTQEVTGLSESHLNRGERQARQGGCESDAPRQVHRPLTPEYAPCVWFLRARAIPLPSTRDV